MIQVPVLIVGGGPVGLTTSILLSRFGIRSLLVERHPSTSLHPKARIISPRTMEIFRQCSLDQAIRSAGVLPGDAPLFAWGQTLTDEQLMFQPITTVTPEAERALSPAVGCGCPQDVLESVLLEHARSNEEADVRFGHELLDFAETGCGISATIRDRNTDTIARVQAQYIVGADGAHSMVREQLGIEMVGPEGISRALSILFRADLSRYVRHRPILLCMIHHPDAPGLLLWTGTNERWCFNAHFPEGAQLEDFSPERLLDLIRTAVGIAELPVEILSCASFVTSARVAASYQRGRVFLAGDAAHEMTPRGGHGMNTGIQDVHNLAWKLAAVIGGSADARLLDTYETERQPVAQWVTAWSLETFHSVMEGLHAPKQDAGTKATRPPAPLAEQGIVFGISYASSAIAPDCTPPTVVANPVTDYVPNARPGARAPHVWLDYNGGRISTLDLFGHEWVLLTGDAGEGWREAAHVAGDALAVTIRAWSIGTTGYLRDPHQAWVNTYGVGNDGAVLIRPDGHVAWRSPGAVSDPRAELTSVLSRVLGHACPQR